MWGSWRAWVTAVVLVAQGAACTNGGQATSWDDGAVAPDEATDVATAIGDLPAETTDLADDGPSPVPDPDDTVVPAPDVADAGSEVDAAPPVEWAVIPGGTFQMGSTEFGGSVPVHAVTVPTFRMARSPITVGQYAACVAAGGCTEAPSYDTGLDQPVTDVTWKQARGFCDWADGRLCSEAEWEYAARNGVADDPFPWGGADPTCDKATFAGGMADGPVFDCTCNGYGCPVCSKPSGNDAWGVCDLGGNVFEWVEDDSHGNYDGAPTDGSPWIDVPRGPYRVIRGNAFSVGALPMWLRDKEIPGSVAFAFSARCCRSVASDVETAFADEAQPDAVPDSGPGDAKPQNCAVVDWVAVPGGAGPAVTVQGFDMSRTEVTVCQYQVCVNDEACTKPHCTQPISGEVDSANCLDWTQADAVCTWAGGRLCSAAEWEYAARNGAADDLYPWGNDAPTCDLARFTDDALECWPPFGAWMGCNRPAGNDLWGICDLSGNVEEWVADECGGPLNHVIRGGGFEDDASTLLGSQAACGDSMTHSVETGARCCRSRSCATDPTVCDDGDPCTTDQCDATSGTCFHSQVPDCQEPEKVDPVPDASDAPETDVCAASCAGRDCGDDGCDGSCGTCQPGNACQSGQCKGNGCPAGYVLIQPGTFTMGAAVAETWSIDYGDKEAPPHPVTISEAYCLKATEVTQAEWKAVMGSNPADFTACGTSCPVQMVSWWDAVAFCNAQSATEGLTPCYSTTGCTGTAGGGCSVPSCYGGPYTCISCPGDYQCATISRVPCTGYRLPTEAEWEYAARAGTATPTYNGSSEDGSCWHPNDVLDPIAWFCGDSTAKYTGVWDCHDVIGSPQSHPFPCGPHPVALRLANAWGLFDMLGNVAEWVWDWWGPYATGPAADPTGAATGTIRGRRGGSWYDIAVDIRAAWRGAYKPDSRVFDVGLRPVRAVQP